MSDALCPNCFQSSLTIRVIKDENMGFASKLKLCCRSSSCGYTKSKFSSPRIQKSNCSNVAFEINTKMVLYSHEIGKGFTSLQTFSSVLGISGISQRAFKDHDNKITDCEVESGEDMLYRTANAIRQAYAETDDDIREAIERGENPLIDISVSYDGTWQKRGFTSLYGVGVCIDLLTGLVVDFDIRSKYCHACHIQKAESMNATDLAVWKEQHDCCTNHHKSSKSMEQDSAVILWNRSVAKYNFRYVEMLSDGDSSAFKAVLESKPYADKAVTKLDCINHAHKRMGTALRKLAKESHLGGRGVGRLTEKKCDSLQNFYRGAIIDNIPDVSKMRNAVWAGLYHSMSTDTEHHHRQCPLGENSWCWYQQAISLGQDPDSHSNHKASTFLSLEVAHKQIPIYRRMSDESLLQRMAHGGTQNNNESLNAMIWTRCPKTSFMGLGRVKGSVARAVSIFNAGANELINVMNKMHIDVSYVTLNNLKKVNDKRIIQSDTTSQEDYRKRRKTVSLTRFEKVREELAKDGNVYGAGAH
ncbi:uncharacterized protein LOC129925822 [Biomphalaria glabrata]|uniref:Uncharacterized protein LOC129925822 n=1 Tax=Biomphalaria glabrata TaxID=6526 RepID=A0A9W3A683_BIOGL|nr:uncharacterized protein LOC129925822 [Biomphalaria glabrata]